MKEYRSFLLVTACFLLASAVSSYAVQIELGSSAPHVCVSVNGGNTTAGTAVISYSCGGSFGQQWNYVNGQLQGLGTANGKSMCLDVKGNSGVSGTLVDLWPCNGQANQQWWILPALAGPNKGNAVIMAFQGNTGPGGTTSVCLDSSGGPSVGGGTQLVVNDCTSGTSQNWIMRRMEIELNTNAPHLCVNDAGSATANGTPVLAYSCTGAFNDEWNISGGQIQGIGTANGISKCLTGAANSAGVGTLVTLSTCNGSASQHWWVLAPSTTSVGEIMGYPSGLCLDSSGGPSGTQLVVNECNGKSSQNWNLR